MVHDGAAAQVAEVLALAAVAGATPLPGADRGPGVFDGDPRAPLGSPHRRRLARAHPAAAQGAAVERPFRAIGEAAVLGVPVGVHGRGDAGVGRVTAAVIPTAQTSPRGSRSCSTWRVEPSTRTRRLLRPWRIWASSLLLRRARLTARRRVGTPCAGCGPSCVRTCTAAARLAWTAAASRAVAGRRGPSRAVAGRRGPSR